MNSLHLCPLPTIRTDDESCSLLMEREGFVDEAVVAAMVRGNLHTRSAAYPDDLALAADDSDFAGWRFSREMLTRSPEVPPQVVDAIVRRATPPALAKPGLGLPHHRGHRWWLAGLAGVLSAMLFSLLLLSFSTRSGSQFGMGLFPNISTTAKPVLAPKAEPAMAAPELTEFSPLGR